MFYGLTHEKDDFIRDFMLDNYLCFTSGQNVVEHLSSFLLVHPSDLSVYMNSYENDYIEFVLRETFSF